MENNRKVDVEAVERERDLALMEAKGSKNDAATFAKERDSAPKRILELEAFLRGRERMLAQTATITPAITPQKTRAPAYHAGNSYPPKPHALNRYTRKHHNPSHDTTSPYIANRHLSSKYLSRPHQSAAFSRSRWSSRKPVNKCAEDAQDAQEKGGMESVVPPPLLLQC